jgi:serine/threonine-protein kinase
VLPADPAAPRRRPWWPWALAGLVLLAAIVGALLLAGGAETRVVPSVTGADQGVAARRLRDEGFRPEFDRVRSDRPRDEVVSQDPRAGTELELGSVVTLTVSDGPGTVAVPDVQNLTRASAQARLERAGLRVRVRREESATTEPGRVIRATPPDGTPVDVGSTVTLVVSRGPQQVTVPDVVGQDLENARGELEGAGLAVTVDREEAAGAEPGTVLRQTPGTGTAVDAGATVTVTVAQEVEEVVVPGVTGRTESQASETLSGAGFRVDIRTVDVDSPDDDGVVQRQSPAGGGRAERGATVTITVGRFDDSALDPEGPGAEPDAEPDATPGDDGTGGSDPGAGAGGTGAISGTSAP